MSIVLPYPVPESGESPFASRARRGRRDAALADRGEHRHRRHRLARASCSPGSAGRARSWAVWATAVLGVVLGPGAALVGIRIGARLFERRGPELLAALRRT